MNSFAFMSAQKMSVYFRLLFGDAPVFLELHEFLLGGSAAEAAEVEFRGDFARRHVGLHELRDDSAGGDFSLDGVAVQHVERLAERGADFFARADLLAIRAAERREEIACVRPSATSTARAPSGSPRYLSFVSVTCVMQSRSTSERMRRMVPFAKLRSSSSLDSFTRVARW